MHLTASPLAVALALALGSVAQLATAQTLPRRDNLEDATAGDVERDAARDRHVFSVAPGRPILARIESGRLLDIELLEGSAPDVWTSQGGALLVRQAPRMLDTRTLVVDSRSDGRRWLRLESGAPVRTVVHARIDARRGGSDPWLVPVAPIEPLLARSRPGRRDHVVRLDTAPVRYQIEGGPLRFDVWRTQRLGLLPPDATWLRIEADGRVLFDGRIPTPLDRERLQVTDGCADVLDLAGRVRVDVPAGTRELRVQGERGTWLKAVAPLPGTPSTALQVASEAANDSLLPAPGESIEQAFDRAVRAYPEPRAQVFLARHGYLRPVAVRPEGNAPLTTQRWRPRFIDLDARSAFPSRRPGAGETPIASLAFHWLPAGARWRIDTAVAGRAGLLRLAVAHAGTSPAAAHLRLEQAGEPAVELRLDPDIVHAMADASSEADGLLALDPGGPAIVEASQVVLPRADVATPMTLVNTGRHGAWVSVDHRVSAPRKLAETAYLAPLLSAMQLQDALLGDRDVGQDNVANAASTRDLDHARRLIAARATRFAGDACVRAVALAGGNADRALDQLKRAQGVDPLLARCAALQAFAAAPDDLRMHAAFSAWATRADQSELRTGAHAWAVRASARQRDHAAWARLAQALAAEGENMAAALASLAAGASPQPPSRVSAIEGVPAESAAAAVRLRTEREIELAYARADAVQPARWRLDRAGVHTLELRATASVPQWVRLQSGARVWWTLLPPVDADTTALRDTATGAAPGLAVRVTLEVPAGGAMLSIAPVAGEVLARLEAPVVPSATQPLMPDGGAWLQRPVALKVTHACRIEDLRTSLAINAAAPPVDIVGDARSVTLPSDAPAIEDAAMPQTATQAALRALRLIEAGRLQEAQAVAAQAHALRESDAVAAAPGVFPELDRHVSFRRVAPVSHGGVVERLVADGRASQPLLARRERWAGLDDEDGFVLRAGQGWVLEGLQPGQVVQLSLRAHAALADRVEVRTTRGDLRQLRDGASVRVSDTADARGELHLRISEGLPGTFVALDVADADGAALEGRRPLAYHRGPVTLRVERPTLLRITEWDGVRSDVRTQWVSSPGQVRIASTRPGGALRISELVLEPASSRSVARGAPRQTETAGASVAFATTVELPSATTAWPQALPDSGGEDGTWGLQAAWQRRTDADDSNDRGEQFFEVRWRKRWQAPVAGGLWGRLDVIGRRHDAGFGVIGLQHDLQWRQADGPWGASLDAAAWRQSTPVGLVSSAHAASARAAVDWSRRRNERWRDEWEIGLRWRALSLRNVDRAFAPRLDNDVYSRYRDIHRRQADIGYRLAWRARYDTEWVMSAQAVSNDLSTADLDNLGAGLEWRWARHGWTASAAFNARRYLRDADRRAAATRRRFELSIGRMLLGADDGWRLRLGAGFDASARQAYGGITVEWFDHDGRGLEDFAPSELFLRGVTETDLAARLLDAGTPP